MSGEMLSTVVATAPMRFEAGSPMTMLGMRWLNRGGKLYSWWLPRDLKGQKTRRPG